MRVLLHNTESNLFYAGGTQWTAEPGLAIDFGTVDLAVQAYKTHRLNFAEIMVDYGRSHHVPLRLPEELPQAAPAPM